MTTGLELDPRTKLITVVCISTLGLVIKDIYYLAIILILTIIVTKFYNVNLKKRVLKR